MGPLVAAIGAGLSAVGGAVGTGATVLGGLTAVSGAASLATTGLQLAKGAPKAPPPIAAPTQAAVPAPTILGAATSAAPKSAGSKSLAALSPGLALGGTGGLNAASPTGQKKSLLGQ